MSISVALPNICFYAVAIGASNPLRTMEQTGNQHGSSGAVLSRRKLKRQISEPNRLAVHRCCQNERAEEVNHLDATTRRVPSVVDHGRLGEFHDFLLYPAISARTNAMRRLYSLAASKADTGSS